MHNSGGRSTTALFQIPAVYFGEDIDKASSILSALHPLHQ